MEKNYSFIAAILVFFIWAVWLFTQEPPAPRPDPPIASKELNQTEPRQTAQDSTDSLSPAAKKTSALPFKKKNVAKSIRTLENEFLSLEIDSNSTRFQKILLKKYSLKKDPQSGHVDLAYDGEGAALSEAALPFGLVLSSTGEEILTGFEEVEFSAEKNQALYRYEEPGRIRVERFFELPANSYNLHSEVRITNLSGSSFKEQQGLTFGAFIPEGSNKGSFLTGPPDTWHSLSLLSDSKLVDSKVDLGEVKETLGNITWSSLGNRYFLLALLPQSQENSKVRASLTTVPGGSVMKNILLGPQEHYAAGEKKEISYQVFLGPKELQVLSSQGHHLDRALNLGFFEFFALFLLRLMQFFYHFVHNWGLAIIILTVLVKVVFFPLSHKSFKSMKEMQRIQPLLKELQERYKDDKEQLNVQMMKIMREHKVNPLGGCLPMLVQMPIYFALYKVLYSSIELRHAPFFLWIQDLSQKDPFFISPILMGVAMFFQQKLSPKPPDPMQAKMMTIMPIMFTGFLLFLPSGLVIYIFCNTALSILQQWYVNKTLDLKHQVNGAIGKVANQS